jgi:DNA-binding NarL/FixJ family response regulator
LRVRSRVYVPIITKGERSGVLAASSATAGAFGDDELSFVEMVASWMSLVSNPSCAFQRRTGTAREHDAVGRETTKDGLTPRQREIATLIADGRSNAEIAARLALSPGTIANYIEDIFMRLGFRRRSQIAAWVVTHQLLA